MDPRETVCLVVAFGLRHFQVVVVLLAGDSLVDQVVLVCLTGAPDVKPYSHDAHSSVCFCSNTHTYIHACACTEENFTSMLSRVVNKDDRRP
jgi:hypothetical protein